MVRDQSNMAIIWVERIWSRLRILSYIVIWIKVEALAEMSVLLL